jgi:DNA-binding response OmpR family regulator
MHTIMIVEDDRALCAELEGGLKKWGFAVFSCECFDSILEEFARIKPQLVIMDVNLPSHDGFYWCRKIREISKVPVLFLSSRDTGMDIIMAVNNGADDYVTKPFSMSVLIARIQAMLRRAYDYSAENPDILECRGAIVNISEGSILYEGSRRELTRNELKIVTLLMKEKGRVVSRERIMQLLWDDDQFVNENTLTVNINRLRGKLAEIGLHDFITTRKGQGYLIS